MESKGKAAAKPTPKQKVLALPGSRWLATRFAPAVPSFLAHISAPKKREDVGGTLWRRDLMTSIWSPDLEDPATVGVLLSGVRGAWKEKGYVSVHHPVAGSLGEPWDVVVTSGLGDRVAVFHGPTEGEALLFALEGAP